ncbi:MAG: methylmalonyl Co-A mutase-associated GTPase MeaB [Saprospiraceae bacterium]|nr:methylmalonyl Co-A mutase-associated GTPase MeaB [Saprospiraceae bacterium]
MSPPPYSRRNKKTKDLSYYLNGLADSNTFVLAEAITIIESTREDHKMMASTILSALFEQKTTKKSVRIAITGSPGAGKSTFIDYFGCTLLNMGHKVAVLSIDPSSTGSGGSILGDKTRMEQLSVSRNAYIRPTASGDLLGGIAAHTKETILLCEAAGFDRIIIETVGIGQNEAEVFYITDINLFLLQPGAGDDLQGIKRGVLENIDIAIVNKSDGDMKFLANETARHYTQSLAFFRHPLQNWHIPVHQISSVEKSGVEKVIQSLEYFEKESKKQGLFYNKRKEQELKWFEKQIPSLFWEWVLTHTSFKESVDNLQKDMINKQLNGVLAIRLYKKLIETFDWSNSFKKQP